MPTSKQRRRSGVREDIYQQLSDMATREGYPVSRFADKLPALRVPPKSPELLPMVKPRKPRFDNPACTRFAYCERCDWKILARSAEEAGGEIAAWSCTSREARANDRYWWIPI